ncbi:LacI family DNA-binding transcriptional regulator [Rugosimonospora africana]|uniref:LacI family DNA-binding transcriptional regulator n=1 Tax=Rugosimonospora africana TaxID=556532 RepID=UPI0023B25FFA|nr:substrate-binding domain-containing protein [Rugosimonospora africana]
MPIPERQEHILVMLRQRGRIRVADLARELGISPITARRDVETLAKQGALRRTHGVAIAIDAPATAGHPQHPAGRVHLSLRQPSPAVTAPVIGMVVPNATYYYADVIRGARAAVAEANGRLVIGITNYDLDAEREQIRQMQARGVHALLLTPAWPTGTSPDEEAERAARLGVPTVLVERRGKLGFPVGELDRACSAHADGGCLAVRHLADLGRRRIGLIARGSPTAAQLEFGYHAALDHLRFPRSSRVVRTTPPRPDPAQVEATLAAVVAQARRGRIDAALVHTDQDAMQFVQQLQRQGLRVPDDIAVVAYDDDLAGLADPPLTAVAPPKFAIGQASVRLAIGRLGERHRAVPGLPSAPRHHLELLPELRIRESCGAPAVARSDYDRTIKRP